jgi:hypothetical protein
MTSTSVPRVVVDAAYPAAYPSPINTPVSMKAAGAQPLSPLSRLPSSPLSVAELDISQRKKTGITGVVSSFMRSLFTKDGDVERESTTKPTELSSKSFTNGLEQHGKENTQKSAGASRLQHSATPLHDEHAAPPSRSPLPTTGALMRAAALGWQRKKGSSLLLSVAPVLPHPHMGRATWR